MKNYFVLIGIVIFSFFYNSCFMNSAGIPVKLEKERMPIQEEENPVSEDLPQEEDNEEEQESSDENLSEKVNNGENQEDGVLEKGEQEDSLSGEENEENPREENISDESQEDEMPPDSEDNAEESDEDGDQGEDQTENDTSSEEEESSVTPDENISEEEPDEDDNSVEEVTPPEEPEIVPLHRDWTVMVYMCADNNLESFAIQDINEMEAGIEDKGSVSVLALIDRSPGYDGTNGNWSDSRLFEIKNDPSGKNGRVVSERISCPDLDLSDQEDTELDLGNPYTLSGFIDFAKREYTADHYALVIWGHGGGWRGYLNDESAGSSMSLSKLSKAIRGKDPDIIVFDTSFGLNFETLYELKDSTRFIVGTSGVNSVAGIDYEKFLKSYSVREKSAVNFIEQLCLSSEDHFYGVAAEKIGACLTALNEAGKKTAIYLDSRIKQKNLLDQIFQKGEFDFCGSYPSDAYINLSSLCSLFVTGYTRELNDAYQTLESAIRKVSVTGDSVPLGIHLIPFSAKGVAASCHSEGYTQPDILGNDGIERCAFVRDAAYWVPSGKNRSFLDALFYRSF